MGVVKVVVYIQCARVGRPTPVFFSRLTRITQPEYRVGPHRTYPFHPSAFKKKVKAPSGPLRLQGRSRVIDIHLLRFVTLYNL